MSDAALFSPALLATATYVMGRDAFLLGEMPRLPSSFRVHWRVLNVDGFHWTLRFESCRIRWEIQTGVSRCHEK
jgi:hypothetical protein